MIRTSGGEPMDAIMERESPCPPAGLNAVSPVSGLSRARSSGDELIKETLVTGVHSLH
jgi:hypothetical protein